MSVGRPARTCVLPVPRGPDRLSLAHPTPRIVGTGNTMPDNAFIEAFNSRVRQECLNASWFLSMADARQRLNEWRTDYNETRPHSALGNLTPSAFAAQLEPTRKVA
jgi:transposase InsO family protein